MSYASPDTRVALVGLGPHARWTYAPALLKCGSPPSLIVELDINRQAVEQYLIKHGIQADTHFVDSRSRDLQQLSDDDEVALRMHVKRIGITKAVIATEPKAHMAYARFFVEHGVSVLMDKPLSSPKNAALDASSAQQIYTDWEELVMLVEDRPREQIYVMAQRRYDQGYVLAKSIVQEVVAEFGVPLSYIDVYHGSGTWNLPREFASREGHPYKYGYGKLLHSGFHFVDLFSWLAECNDALVDKRPDSFELYHTTFGPKDALFQIDRNGYAGLFGDETAQRLFDGVDDQLLDGCGELDSHSLIDLRRDGHLVTTGNLSLMDNTFSRRAWSELPEDTYKGNGRTRHIRLNLQVGPLLNVQVHSYESQRMDELSDGTDPGVVGGWDHFDVHVFRNTALIGGARAEVIHGEEAGRRSGTAADNYSGQNREARLECVREFLSGSPSDLDIRNMSRTHRLLTALHESSANRRSGRSPLVGGQW